MGRSDIDGLSPDPKAFVPKTKMVFAGLKKPEDIEDLIAFLKTKP